MTRSRILRTGNWNQVWRTKIPTHETWQFGDMSICIWKILGLRANADIDADLTSGRALIHLFVPVRRAWLRNREGYRRRVNSIGTTKLSPEFTMVISDRCSGLKLASVWEQIFSLYGESSRAWRKIWFQRTCVLWCKVSRLLTSSSKSTSFWSDNLYLVSHPRYPIM